MKMRAAIVSITIVALALIGCWPTVATAQPIIQVITSAIGDFDCFGYGAPAVGATVRSPCGTLPADPVREADDGAGTDTLIACPTPSSVAFNHRFAVPSGGTILGAVWQMNIGGVELTKYPGRVLLNGVVQVALPETGALGTGLVVIPLIGALTDLLSAGALNVQVVRGQSSTGACDDVFVDFSALTIVVGF